MGKIRIRKVLKSGNVYCPVNQDYRLVSNCRICDSCVEIKNKGDSDIPDNVVCDRRHWGGHKKQKIYATNI